MRWANNRWLTWSKPIDRLHLFEERTERVVHMTIDATLLAFAVVGAISGALAVAQLINQEVLSRGAITILDILNQAWTLNTGGTLLFWLSIVTDLYLFYRFDQRHRLVAPIPALPGALVPPPAVADVAAVPAEKTIDVSRSYTRPTQIVVEQAFVYALRLGHDCVESVHLLAAAASQPDVATALVRLGISRQPLNQRLARALAKVQRGAGEPRLSPKLRAVLVRSYELAQTERLLQVTPPHLLEALSREPSSAQEILFDLEADEQKVHNVVLWSLMQRRLLQAWSRLRTRALTKPKSGMDRAMTAQATPVLDHFSTDLTQLARRGLLPLVVDRERELDDVFRVVESGRHNVILVGEKGVGTTSLLQALAERMAAEDVPEVLSDKRLALLSVSSLVSGAGGGGALEQRLEEIIVEIVKAGNIVLAIEDIHELVGVSSVSGESLDLAAILGKVLENRAFVAFATSTIDGYRRYVEPSALFSAFEKVAVDEVFLDVAIQILESKAGAVEARHRVFFSYAAIEKIVHLSNRYIHDRRLPEKALTLLDEVGSYTRAAKGERAVVTGDDAAAVISRRTNTNVAAVTEDEASKLLHLEERMHQRMVGQDYAVTAVANALRRSRAELRDPKRPIGVFLFLGPTGVGKTELAKTVAEVYFNDEQNMIRLDMSEYQDTPALSRLLGAPAGYGGATGGYLTEAVRTNPFSLVLLDELEKAHPDVLNVFLQVFDDGRLTDSSGRTIDFTNTIIIATSNAGTDVIQQRMKEGRRIEQIRQELVEAVLGQYFRPEFLNRFDDVIVFTPLSPEEIAQITERLLQKVATQLAARGITLRASGEAIRELAAAGFDPMYGARPLRRVIQEKIDNALATFLLTGKLGRRDVATLEAGGIIRVERAPQL
ncbi:MAG: ATP-dependent Clp protease ATP-binding subunit [Candidatus Kerfeldbacteria bacterium]|nr:ATP-dependent Clp protease ATP-binding subunit [Candidatus Kerfeldbacteria bacterium]